MRKIVTFLTIIAFTFQNAPFVFALHQAMVESVRVSSESVYIRTSKPVDYKAFMVSRPPKVVVDLKNATLKTLQEIPAKGTFLKRVRTGQYQRKPLSIARIVLELSQKAAYDVIKKGNEIIVVVGGKIFSRRAKKKGVFKSAPKDTPHKVIETIIPDAAFSQKEAAEITTKVATRKMSRSENISYSNDIMENLPSWEISYDFADADVKDVLNIMADKAGINLVFGDDISGNITLNLNKVPFDEAFRTVLNIKNLATQQIGDKILRVASPATFEKEQEKALPQTRVFFLDYAKASDVQGQITNMASAQGRKATVTTDENNNAVIVTDTPLGLEETERLIRNLDRPPRQVLIEAKLVEVSLNNDFNLGIKWSAYGEKKGTYFGIGDADKGLKSGAAAPGMTYKTDGSGTGLPLGADSSGTGVNLPANIIYGTFRLGKVAANYMFDAILSAAASRGKAKILSDPKVATLNNQEATINITTQIPYTTTETTGSTPPISTTKVVYVTTGIILKVTPTITSDGKVALKINPEVSQVSPTIQAVAGGAPGIDTRSADTTVITSDGETIVIGGLIHDYKSEGEFKVPLLGDLPLIGWLFKKKTSERVRRELLIFVTPRIIS